MADQYDTLTHSQLVNLLRKRDGDKKLGLVWERDEIEADAAIDANFVACTLDAALSDGAAPWGNLVIEGDNFDALRWLRMAYARRVKCIYIDPPYNTGNKDWVYNDHYVDPNDKYRHSTWLEFLFRRLQLARDLLASDGVILVSINDENRAKLELLMDEALPGMRIGSFAWRTRTGGNDNKGAFFTADHEHVLAYGNRDFGFLGNEKTFDLYDNFDPVRQDWFQKDNLTKAHGFKERPNTFYPIYDPESDVYYPCSPDNVWRFASRLKMAPNQKLRSVPIEDLIQEGRVYFPETQRIEIWNSMAELLEAIDKGDVPWSGNAPKIRRELPDLDFWIGKRVGFGTPRFKRFRKDLRNATQPLSSWITPRAEKDTVEAGANAIVSGTNDEGAKVIKGVFGEKAFNYAKPVSLIRELVRQSTGPDDLVLDFFAGSATTAQAVMELNAEDNGARRFIMVSSTEATEAEPDKNICRDVTAERIRRLNALDSGKYADLSAEFAYLRTREIDFEAINAELEPAEAWNALEAMHGLPLTPHDPARGWNEHGNDALTLVLADRTDEGLIARLHELAAARANVFVYSWAPGQVRNALGPVDFEVLPVRETLVKRFTA